MPRYARLKSETGIYHIMLRGINKQNIFEDQEDKLRFIDALGYYKEKSHYVIYGYCLMDNHVHLLIQELDDPISKIIKRISSSYVYWYNKKYKRCGHLFQERFKSEAIETEAYLLTVLKYIHKNPVKAGVVKSEEEYFWSSYHDYIGNKGITNIDFILKNFSNNKIEAVNLFKKYTEENNDEECLDLGKNSGISDEEVIKYLKKLGIAGISELQQVKKENRDLIIRQLKEIDNITIRQIARIIGISKSTIQRM